MRVVKIWAWDRAVSREQRAASRRVQKLRAAIEAARGRKQHLGKDEARLVDQLSLLLRDVEPSEEAHAA